MITCARDFQVVGNEANLRRHRRRQQKKLDTILKDAEKEKKKNQEGMFETPS